MAFDQDPAVQEAPLRHLISQRGWHANAVHSDRISGSKEHWAGRDRMMAHARCGEFDIVIVWRFSRFARRVRPLVNALEQFRDLVRSVIRERVIAGIEFAPNLGRHQGKRWEGRRS